MNNNFENYIFMTNTMRAGSSYLTRILSAHPNISMSYDTVNFFRFCYQKYNPITNEENFLNLAKDMSFRLKNRFDIDLNIKTFSKIVSGRDRSYATAYLGIQKTIFPNKDKIILGDKEALAWTKIPNFLDMFPKGKVIMVVRDPRDVVNSFKKITIAPENDYLISLFDSIDAINHAVRYSRRFPENVHMVKFEQLKLHPKETVRDICKFIGVDFNNKMLDEENFTDHFGNKWDQIKSKSCPDETDRLAAVGRWQHKLDSDDLYLCERIARDAIQKIGLQLSGKKFTLDDFKNSIAKIMSSKLLQEAFKNWCDTGEGVEKFPLDPTNPSTWETVKNPDMFK